MISNETANVKILRKNNFIKSI